MNLEECLHVYEHWDGLRHLLQIPDGLESAIFRIPVLEVTFKLLFAHRIPQLVALSGAASGLRGLEEAIAMNGRHIKSNPGNLIIILLD